MSSRHPDRRWVLPSAIILAAALTGFGARSLWSRPVAQPPAAAVPVSAAQVVRTDVAQRQVVSGTIGYQGAYSVVNELPAGIVTAVPQSGQVVTRGQALYQIAGQPVTLLYGATPAWRDIGPASTPGPDVKELDRNLNALGFDAGPPGDTYTWQTEAAIDRWQQAHGMTETGTIPLGEVSFLPGPLRVTASSAGAGTPAAPGTPVLTATSTTPSVQVNLTPGGPPVHPGDSVLVTLPDGTTTMNGAVLTVGSVTQAPAQGQQSTQTTPQAIIPVTIGLGGHPLPSDLDQAPVQVTLTEQIDHNVLAVPVTALLAQAGGGYAVRSATGPRHQLIPVTVGLYDDTTGLVEVTGTGLTAGMTVQVAQA